MTGTMAAQAPAVVEEDVKQAEEPVEEAPEPAKKDSFVDVEPQTHSEEAHIVESTPETSQLLETAWPPSVSRTSHKHLSGNEKNG